MAEQDDKQHDFRKEENRAHSKNSGRPQRIPVSHFIEKITPGKTLWGYQFAQEGLISDLSISLGYHNGDPVPVNVEIKKNEGVMEIQRALQLGDNEFHKHTVKKGDQLVFKSRELEDVEYSARNVFISFNLIVGKRNV